ncbi:ABC transporter permease [Microbacterium saperdae]
MTTTMTTLLPRPDRSPQQLAWRRFRRNPVAVAGTLVLIAIVGVTIVAPLLSPVDPNAIDLQAIRRPPSPEHLLGTDSTGRDVLARLLAGGQVSLTVGFLAAAIAVGVGALVGAAAGWFGGAIDAFISRSIDILLSVPTILVVIVVAGILGPSVPMLVAIIAGLAWPASARIARGVVLGLKEQEFIQAARVSGSRNWFIIRRHLLPGVLPPVTVAATLLVSEAVLLESALSFLGAGVRPPQASWGNMLTEAQSLTVLSSMPWLWLPPGIMIALTVLCAMAMGDGIGDAINPKRNK